MAALRSGLAILGRRSCGCSGSSAAASMGGRGMGIHQVLRPVAVRNLKSWRHFYTEGGELKDKADSFPRLVWQWAKYRVENAGEVAKTRAVGVYILVSMGTPILYMMNTVRNWRPSP